MLTQVCVLGASGFVGRHLVQHLRTCVDIEVTAVQGRADLDLTDAAVVQTYFEAHLPFDVVFVCCAEGGRRTAVDEDTVYERNVAMVLNVVNHSRARRVVHFTSGAALDRSQSIGPDTVFDERRIPSDPYGRAKHAIELATIANSQVTHIRIFGCSGSDEGEARFMTTCSRAAHLGIPIVIPEDRRFGIISVATLCCVCQALVRDIDGAQQHIELSGPPLLLSEIARQLGAAPLVLSDVRGKDYCGRCSVKTLDLLSDSFSMPQMHAVVFGASGSIGGAIAKRFDDDGWAVTTVSHATAIDTTWPPRDLAGVNVVVWAGGVNLNDSVDTFAREDFEKIVGGNCGFVLETVHKLRRAQKLAYGARLCVVSSIWQTHTRTGKLSYTVSKAAVGGAVRALAADLADRQILVNAVLPGAVDNSMTRATMSEAGQASVRDRTGFHRMVGLGEVTNAVAALTQTYTGITGQSVPVDLGFTTTAM